jgi:hypothetical protein
VMKSIDNMPYIRLAWRKTRGCYDNYGLKETLRRMIKEIIRKFRRNRKSLDISFLTDNLAIGAAPESVEEWNAIFCQGFTNIIDLRAERKEMVAFREVAGDIVIKYVPTYDDWRVKPRHFFRQLADEIEESGLSECNARLLLCCGEGEHRAPLAGLLALVIMGYTLDDAASIIAKKRPVAELLPIYISSLNNYLEEGNVI